MIVWKHHLADDFEKNGVPVMGNGVGRGGTVFTDFRKMEDWLRQNDPRRFYVAPIQMQEHELKFNPKFPFMADAIITRQSVGPFRPIDSWRGQLPFGANIAGWYGRAKVSGCGCSR